MKEWKSFTTKCGPGGPSGHSKLIYARVTKTNVNSNRLGVGFPMGYINQKRWTTRTARTKKVDPIPVQWPPSWITEPTKTVAQNDLDSLQEREANSVSVELPTATKTTACPDQERTNKRTIVNRIVLQPGHHLVDFEWDDVNTRSTNSSGVHRRQLQASPNWNQKRSESIAKALQRYTLHCSPDLYWAWSDAADGRDWDEFNRLSEEIRKTRIPKQQVGI